jgi:hypothetical protein
MTKDFDDLFSGWIEDGPTRASDRVVEALRSDVARTRQRTPRLLRLRSDPPMKTFLRLGAVAGVAVVLFVTALNLAPGRQPSAGASPDGSAPSPSSVTTGSGGPWSAVPISVDRATVDGIEDSCQNAFAVAKDLPVRHPEHVIGVPVALVDARGLGIAHALFSAGDGGAGGLCWDGEVTADGSVRRAEAAELLLSWPSDMPTPEEADWVCVSAMAAHDWRGRQGAYSFAGRTSPSVQSVVIRVEGVGDITPTFQGGWFVAWWPGPSDQYTVIGKDATGEPVGELSKRRIDDGWPCSVD